jgi:FkbM family methyltransferase
MEKIKEVIVRLLRKTNKQSLQKMFENLYLFSLHGMGFGECEMETDGERVMLIRLGKEYNKREKLTIFDVGANIGKYSMACLECTKNPEIYSFEPSKKTFKILMDNLKDRNIKTYNIGFGDKNGTKTLFYDTDGTGLASLYDRDLKHRDIYFTKNEKVKIETIDSFCKRNKIENIDLLKMDVEGNELNILKGAKEMLKNRKIKKIQFEFGGCNIDARTFFRDFWNILSEDYHIYRMVYKGLYLIKEYKEYCEIFATVNYLAILKSRKI